MRLTVACLAMLLFSLPANADDDRAVRKRLIRELLAVIDIKHVTQETVRTMWPSDESSTAILDRVFARIDYDTITDTVFEPRFDETFTTAELRELIAFHKNAAGQKSFRLFVELIVSGGLHGVANIQEISEAIREELVNEDLKKNPWKRTLADLRMVATAAESYATDTNRYPAVASYGALKDVLSPTYIREIPEKDVWGTPYSYTVSSDGVSYRFASSGADGRFEWESRQVVPLPEDFQARVMDSLDADIIFQDGFFVQFPAQAKKDLEP